KVLDFAGEKFFDRWKIALDQKAGNGFILVTESNNCIVTGISQNNFNLLTAAERLSDLLEHASWNKRGELSRISREARESLYSDTISIGRNHIESALPGVEQHALNLRSDIIFG